MGIYDRDYIRNDRRGYGDGPSAVTTLIIINVAVFVLQLLTQQRPFGFGPPLPGPVTDWLDLNVDKVMQGQVWRLLTHAFLHDQVNVFHVVLNMLVLFMFGRDIESIYGSREFTAFYLTSAVIAGTVYTFVHYLAGDHSRALGASGAVSAVFILFACHYPHHTIRVMLILPMPVWVAAALFVGQDLLMVVFGAETNVAVDAHLAGAGFGFIYKYFGLRVSNWIPRVPASRGNARRRQQPKLRVYTESRSAPESRATAELPTDEQLEARVDEVLAKVSRYGKESLTAYEQTLLARAGEIYKKRRT